MNKTKEYKKGDTIRYKTIKKRFERNAYSVEIKTGIIEEAFTTVEGIPCYWIKGEKYLVLQTMLIE